MEPIETPSRGPAPAPGPRPERWRLRRVELAGILAFWTIFALLGAANRLLDPRGPGLAAGLGALSSAPVLVAFFESYLWAALTPGVFWLSSRLSRSRSGWAGRAVLALGVGLGVAVAVDVLGDVFRVYALDVERWRARGVSPVRTITLLWFLNDLIVFGAILAVGFAREYFLRYQARQAEAVQLQGHAARLQAQLAEARLHALRMQINPHFLFNTLHAVSTLVERDPRGVRRMIARLSELLRYTLEGRGDHEIPLDQEIDFLRKYLEIMQIRFQGRLEVALEVDAPALAALVPNLILQPLVENAIKHGVGNLTGTGRIEVRAHREGERLVLAVRDNGPGLDAGAADGVGLRNTRDRLEQLYGEDQELSVRNHPDGGLVAEIRLPFHTGTDLRAAAVSGVAEPADV